MRANWSVILCVMATASVAVNCGSSGTTVETACADLALAQCNQRQACSSGNGAIYPDGVYIMSNYGDMTTCRSRIQEACINNSTAPGTGNTPDQLEKCAKEYSAWSCADLFDNNANPPPDCAPPGKLANGQLCAFAAQCATRFCAGIKNATCGVCADEPLDGDSCLTSTCAPGQVCKTEFDKEVLCRDRLPINDATCTSDLPCQAFLACVGASPTDPTQTGVCTPTSIIDGSACGGTNLPCESTVGLACLGAAGAKTCQRISYARAPAACGTVGDGRAECITADCFTSNGPAATTDTDATCVGQAADGAACDTQFGPLCLLPARCVTAGVATTAGTCVVTTAAMAAQQCK